MKFSERVVSFEQIDEGLPADISQNAGKRGGIKKGAIYRILVSSDRYVRFGDDSVTCTAPNGYLLKANEEYFIQAPNQDKGKRYGFIAFSVAINPANDNIVRVK